MVAFEVKETPERNPKSVQRRQSFPALTSLTSSSPLFIFDAIQLLVAGCEIFESMRSIYLSNILPFCVTVSSKSNAKGIVMQGAFVSPSCLAATTPPHRSSRSMHRLTYVVRVTNARFAVLLSGGARKVIRLLCNECVQFGASNIPCSRCDERRRSCWPMTSTITHQFGKYNDFLMTLVRIVPSFLLSVLFRSR